MWISPTQLDETVLRWVVANRSEPWISVAHVLSAIGGTLSLTIATVVVVVVLVMRRRIAEAVFLGGGALSGLLLMISLKRLFARPRPPVGDRLVVIDSYAFPSGHAMMTMIVFGLFAVTAYRCVGWVVGHRWVLLLAPLASGLIGLSRIYLAVHWTTDVIAGWLFGAAWVLLCTWLLGVATESGRGAGRWDARTDRNRR
ncbi:phosphatase PAP2 family protein [Gordonia sp. ABSL1-1]|uniref:phosphatase PAP2 family protein n=1 Tax=Gordonia sp. ABSL1-1 TaxID=3053923 RepID=UPI0025738E25|nr:phosphatase PAP2 family protein [Gordonia sp. ABSL1-1]MDL9937779.1 phosphatase PAP2 family protein [Gordonia sp. ABSL1-1]